MIPLSALVAVALAGGAVWIARTRGEPEALATFSLALGVALASPLGLVVLSVGLVLALRAGRARAAVERERALAADHLAAWKLGAPVLSPPAPKDRLAADALTSHGALVAEHLAAMEADAQRAARSAPGVRARFMAAMGHDLRSPLNSIMGFAQLLEDGSDGPLNDAQRENVVMVRRASQELLTLLTDILDAARIEAGRAKLDRQWTAPVEVLTLALERLRAAADADLPAIEAELQPGLSPLFVDRARLAQAVLNVLRATVRPRAALRARVREAREGEQSVIRFELHDRERAVSDADALRAFDPDPDARPQGRSLALGLALSVARDLAQLHGGDARAESFDGGTLWILWVPATSPDAPPPKQARPAARGGVRGGRGR